MDNNITKNSNEEINNGFTQLRIGNSDTTSTIATHHHHQHLPTSSCDERHHNNLNYGDVSVEEGDAGADTEDSLENSAAGSRRDSSNLSQGHNIPYMQLFHHLKQKFPDLKDGHINESIQKVSILLL